MAFQPWLGQLAYAQSCQRQRSECQYDGNGNLTLSIQLAPDPEDADQLKELSRSQSWYDDNLLQETTDALGNTTQYVYDGKNNLIKTVRHVTDPETDELVDVNTAYSYDDSDAPHAPSSITGPQGLTRYFDYDENGRQTKSWYYWQDANNAGNNATISTISIYDDAGRVVETRRVVDGNGAVTDANVLLSQTQYNTIARPDVVINQHGALSKYYYDELGNLVESRSYVDQQTYEADANDCLSISRTVYDKLGRAIVTAGPYDPCEPNVPGTESVYDALGRVIWTRTWEDVAIPLADLLDDSNNVIGKTNTFTEANEPNWSRGKLLSVSKSYYNKAGRLWKSETQDENGDYQPTYYEYDKAGKQTAVTDALTNRTEYEYTGSRRVLTRDALGHVTQFVHDDLGRLVRTIYDDSTSTYTDFDEFSRRIVHIDQADRVRRFEYDKAGRLTAVTLPDVNDPENSDTPTHPRYEYEYDDYGNLTLIRDKVKLDRDSGQIDANSARETTFTYNELNLQASRTLPNGKTEYKYYDEKAQLIKAVDFEKQVTGFEYNNRGLLEFQKFYDSNSNYPDNANWQYEFAYDNLGRRTTVEVNDFGGTPGIYTNYYDAQGRLHWIDSPYGTVRYQYSDTTGRIRSVYTPAGTADTEIDYYYDPLGRLAEVEAAQLNSEPVSDITKYAYNAVGSLAIVDYNNGNVAEYTYDALNRLTSLTNWQSASKVSALSSYTYTLSPDGQRAAVTEQTSEGTTKIQWSYDNLNRLVAEDYNAPAEANDFAHDYVYDLVGNRKSKTVDDTVVTNYYYNNADQLTQEATDGDSIAYEYDDNGALTLKDAGSDPNFAYGYDLRGRLSQVDIESGATVGYTYNPDGIRVRSTVDGSAIDYVVDSHNHTGYAQVLKQINSITGANTVYVTGLDVLAQATGAASPQYFLYDGHGSVRALASNAGAVVERYNYEAYGTLHNFTGTPSTNLLYTGEMRDPHTAQYYLRARWYNPSVGRFSRLDAFAGSRYDPPSLHKYLYAHANPINNIDPSGQVTFMEILEVSLIIGMIVATTAATETLILGGSGQQVVNAYVRWFWISFIASAALYGGIWATKAILVSLYGAGAGVGNLQHAKEYGIRPYGEMSKALSKTGLHAHHIVQQRFAPRLALKVNEMASVAVTPAEHLVFRHRWQNAIPYGAGTSSATKEIIWERAQVIYRDYPALLDAARAELGI